MQHKNLFVALFAMSSAQLGLSACAEEKHHEIVSIYSGAQVWTGECFQRRDIALRDGWFVDIHEAGEDPIRIDVSGKYITPPYGNAHHHITGDRDDVSWAFIKDGVFYVWNPTLQSTTYTQEEAEHYTRKDTYDVRVAMGAITEPGGHPEKLYVETLSQYVYPGKGFYYFYGAAFHYGRTHDEIDKVLQLLTEQGAQFIKVMLLYSEEYEKRRHDDAYYGLKGINPKNMPHLVKVAHGLGKRVAVHIETRHDALVAAKAGADMLAHLPGYVSVSHAELLENKMALSEVEVQKIAEQNMLVVPTYAIAAYQYANKKDDDEFDQTIPERHYAVQAENLRLLSNATIKILTGTDSYPHIYDEAAHWVEIGGLTTEEALQAVYQTGRHLFPDRKIGHVGSGHEADFLVLGANPLENIRNLSAIEMRIKGGKLITEHQKEN